MEFALHLPINSVSFGQVSINILKEVHKRGLNPFIFSIGPDDFSAFKLSDDFKLWFNTCKDKGLKSYNRDVPVFKLWHLDDSIQSYGKKQILFTFHECDQATEVETNIVKNNTKVLFSSKYSRDIFQTFGCNNVGNLPLGFDFDSFHVITNRQYVDTGVIQFGLAGKLEKRKQHAKIINLWVKKYGNNPKYKLNCALFNPFLPLDVQNNLVMNAMEGKNYWNVNFLPFMQGNDAYNDFLNSNSIILGLSSAEGFGLPEFQSVALGKHALILNATGYREWATPENSVLVNPMGKISLADGVFFREGHYLNQGSGFDWSENSFYKGMEEVITRFEANPINEAGLKLQKDFTYEKTVDKILFELDQLNSITPII